MTVTDIGKFKQNCNRHHTILIKCNKQIAASAKDRKTHYTINYNESDKPCLKTFLESKGRNCHRNKLEIFTPVLETKTKKKRC